MALYSKFFKILEKLWAQISFLLGGHRLCQALSRPPYAGCASAIGKPIRRRPYYKVADNLTRPFLSTGGHGLSLSAKCFLNAFNLSFKRDTDTTSRGKTSPIIDGHTICDKIVSFGVW